MEVESSEDGSLLIKGLEEFSDMSSEDFSD